MKIKKILIPLLLIILLASITAFGSNIPLGPYFDDTYFDLSDSALILKIVPHEKGGLEADVSAYDGLIKITGGATSNLTIGIGDDNIVEMDDADAAVDDYCKLTVNGIVGRSYSEVKTDLSLNYVENLKVKLDGTQAPTVNNDTDEGYVVGSRWFDVTNDKEYVCLDNTDGAAVWTETTGAGGGAGTYLELTDTPAAYDNGKYAKSTADGVVWDTPAGAGTVTTSGTPVQYDYARFTDATTIEGRSYSEMKTDLAYQLSDLSNVGATTPPDKYVLIADGDSWESRALVEADISDLGTYIEDITGESIADLSDVDTTDIANEKILQYNSTSGNWECEDAGGAGETNTASNIGSEVEIFKQKTDVDLEFRTLKANSNKITISVDGGEGAKTDYQDGYASGIID